VHLLQAAVLGLQFGHAEGAVDDQAQQLGLEGLGEEVVGAHGHGAQRVGLVVLAGQHDDLDVGVGVQQLLQQLETFAGGVGVGRQAQVHRHHRRLVAAEGDQCGFAVARRHAVEAVQRPLDLLLQRQVVLDDQQGPRLCRAHAASAWRRSVPVRRSNSGTSRVTTVPWPTSLFTSMLPPSSLMY